MLIIFSACLAIIAYVYFGYPLLLRLGAIRRRGTSPPSRHTQPSVSIIVAAHNEESCIEDKIRNSLALEYPRECVEIVIGSDGSSDRTEEIVQRFAKEGVGLVSFPQQRGKSAIQNGLVARASGAILVFTDADCLVPAAALSQLIEHFADPRLGLVSACPRFRNASETDVTGNESIYLRYETWLRRRESELGLLAMASGSLFAMRRSLWQPLAPHFGDDFVLPLRVIRAGMINCLGARVIAHTNLSQTSPASMFRMKARIISKDFGALVAHHDLLNPFRHGAVAVALWSHKLLRWFVPYFLLALFVSNVLLLNQPFFRVFFAAQLVFYLAAVIGFCFRNLPKQLPWSVPMSFCLVNLAAFAGTLKAIAGRSAVHWKPERRSSSSATAPPAAPSSEFR